MGLLLSQPGPYISLRWQLRGLFWEMKWASSSLTLITILTPEALWPRFGLQGASED